LSQHRPDRRQLAKLACRRAGVSVVSPVFSVRRDRRSASDPSIARRSRSSISSFKCPRPSAMFGLRGNQICDIARGGLFGRANLLHSRANMRWTFVGVACARRLASYGCRKRLRRAGHGGRTSSPASESMVERGRSLVAQQPGNLRKGHTGLLEILERQSAPQLVYDLLVGRSLDIEPARKRSHAHAERLCEVRFCALPCGRSFSASFSTAARSVSDAVLRSLAARSQKGSSALSSFRSAVRSGAVTAAFENSSRSDATPSSAARPNSTGQPKKRANSRRSALRACANATRIGRMSRPP